MARAHSMDVVVFVANPTITAVTPTGGAAGSFTYKLVGVDSTGAVTAASAGTAIANGPTTLDVTHYNTITWTDVAGITAVRIYRTAGGLTQGLLGTVLAGVQTFRDNGLVGDGATPSATNGTGVGPAVPCLELADLSAVVAGTFTATVKFQGKIGGSDWADVTCLQNNTDLAVNITAPAFCGLGVPTLSQVRLVMTAYTSGTVTAEIAGH